MLLAINLVMLIADIALLAMFGQWVLGLLAGARKDQNLFYQILAIVGRPFVVVTRLLTPKVVIDRHIPIVAFLILVFLRLGFTVLKISHCLQIGVELCK